MGRRGRSKRGEREVIGMNKTNTHTHKYHLRTHFSVC